MALTKNSDGKFTMVVDFGAISSLKVPVFRPGDVEYLV